MAGKPKRARTERREHERRMLRLGRDRERLFAKEPGGSPELPLEVDSASVVDVRARSTRCPRCDGEHSVEEHRAVESKGVRLREARLLCRSCGSRRSLWFRLPVIN
jgi:hypothetical protein